MKARIIQIGNSRGIRIPKVLLEESGLPEDVELRMEDGRIVIEAASEPRVDWAEAARRAGAVETPGRTGESGTPTPADFPATDFDVADWAWE
jgi:antitoxin MazE